MGNVLHKRTLFQKLKLNVLFVCLWTNVGTGVILIFIYYKCYITVFDNVFFSIHLWCF